MTSLTEARWLLENWRRQYNEERPHSRLAYLTPVEFARRSCLEAPDREACQGKSPDLQEFSTMVLT